MPAISAELRKLLIATDLFIFPEDFVVVYLPQDVKAIPGEWFRKATTRFAMVIQEPKMVTMIISRRKWLRMQNIFDKYEANGPWKIVSLKLKKIPIPSGYLSTIASALKDSNIQIIPTSTLKSVHLLVPKADFPKVVRILRDFLEGFKKQKKTKKTKDK